MNRSMKASLLAILGCGVIAGANSGVSASELFDTQSNCTETSGTPPSRNCSSIQGLGDVFNNTTSGHVGHKPWVAQVYTGGNECVRIDVLSPAPTGATDQDLEATLTCPNGLTWHNDDKGPNNAPLIKAKGTGAPGWCTLTIAPYDGRNVQTNFDVRYGRYPLNHADCSSSTNDPATTQAQWGDS